MTSTGVIYWEKSLGGTNHEQAHSVKQTSDGGYIIAGYSASNDGDVSGSHGYEDYWVVKLSSSGIIEWQKSLGGSGIDYGAAVQETTDGGYLVAGTTSSTDGNVTNSFGFFDAWLVQLSSTGNIIWQKTYGGSNYDVINSASQTSDGGFIFSGWSASTDGDVTGNHGDADYLVVKLSSFVGLEKGKRLTKLDMYPNPANNQITVNTSSELIGSTYSVFDFTGKIILSGTVNSENTTIELKSLPNGLYVLQFETVGGIITSRFVKQ